MDPSDFKIKATLLPTCIAYESGLHWRLLYWEIRISILKVHPSTDHEGPEWECRYSSTLSLTLALDGGGEWSKLRPGRFTPIKTRYPLYGRLGGSRSGRVQKISPSPEFDPRTSQPVASRSIDYAIPAHTCILIYLKPQISQLGLEP
jgi:hypothetical protein